MLSAAAFEILIAEHGAVVTHVPRAGSQYDVMGVFSQAAMTPIKDNRQGRSNSNSGSLLFMATDVDGNVQTPDDQGYFIVAGERLNITNLTTIDGGYSAIIGVTENKTMRSLHGNS